MKNGVDKERAMRVVLSYETKNAGVLKDMFKGIGKLLPVKEALKHLLSIPGWESAIDEYYKKNNGIEKAQYDENGNIREAGSLGKLSGVVLLAIMSLAKISGAQTPDQLKAFVSKEAPKFHMVATHDGVPANSKSFEEMKQHNQQVIKEFSDVLAKSMQPKFMEGTGGSGAHYTYEYNGKSYYLDLGISAEDAQLLKGLTKAEVETVLNTALPKALSSHMDVVKAIVNAGISVKDIATYATKAYAAKGVTVKPGTMHSDATK